jgi:Fungal Zn(2)-Cys(6) binuclear cluster domain
MSFARTQRRKSEKTRRRMVLVGCEVGCHVCFCTHLIIYTSYQGAIHICGVIRVHRAVRGHVNIDVGWWPPRYKCHPANCNRLADPVPRYRSWQLQRLRGSVREISASFRTDAHLDQQAAVSGKSPSAYGRAQIGSFSGQCAGNGILVLQTVKTHQRQTLSLDAFKIALLIFRMMAARSPSRGTAQRLSYDPIRRSALACNRCRGRKTKCTGTPPYPCSTCQDAGVDCVYTETERRVQVRERYVMRCWKVNSLTGSVICLISKHELGLLTNVSRHWWSFLV